MTLNILFTRVNASTLSDARRPSQAHRGVYWVRFLQARGFRVYEACANQLTIRSPGPDVPLYMRANINFEMIAFTDFRRWLWTDWGRPNFLTRMGIPRIVTSVLAFVLFFIALVYLQLRYVSPGDRVKVRLFLHNPFFLAAYAALYVGLLAREFLSFKYKVKGRALDKAMRENWSEPFVKISMFALVSMFLLLLIGSLVYRLQLK